MKNISFISACLLTAAVLAGCKSEIPEYSGVAGVYFAMNAGSTALNTDTMYVESSSLPFIVTDSRDSVFKLLVKIMGPVSSHDRHVKVAVVQDESDVLPGDYEPLPEYYTLRAGEVYAAVPIRFFRTQSLQGTQRTLTVGLVANDDFSLPIKVWRNSSTESVSVVKHSIVISDKYVQLPGFSVGYFGPFSEKKMKLLLEIFDMKLSDFNYRFSITKGRTMGQRFDRYLKEQKAQGRTVYEDDGTEMVAGDYIYQ